MKKLLSFLIVALLSFTAVHAQTFSNVLPLQSDQTIHKAGLDTATNATAVYQYITIKGSANGLTFQAGVNKLTGTPAGGLRLLGSIDNVKWDFVTTATDTLAVTNITGWQTKTWKLTRNDFIYYKLRYLPSGTQTSTLATKVLIR